MTVTANWDTKSPNNNAMHAKPVLRVEFVHIDHFSRLGDLCRYPPSNMEHRKRLLARIEGLANSSSPLPIVTLAQFFEGNTYHESIIGDSNSSYHPQTLYSIFRPFRDFDGIHDVFVEIKEIGHSDKWPVADTFWVVATADPRQFLREWPPECWGNNLPCDYVTFPRKDGRTTEPLEIPVGMVAIGMQYYNMS